MEIRKTYRDINPTLLYDEIKEFVQRQGVTLDQNRLETYSMPTIHPLLLSRHLDL